MEVIAVPPLRHPQPATEMPSPARADTRERNPTEPVAEVIVPEPSPAEEAFKTKSSPPILAALPVSSPCPSYRVCKLDNFVLLYLS